MLTVKPKTHVIQEIRIRKGFTQKKLAEKAKLNALTILNIENGISTPNPATALKIREALGVEFDDIFEIVPDMPESKPSTEHHEEKEG